MSLDVRGRTGRDNRSGSTGLFAAHIDRHRSTFGGNQQISVANAGGLEHAGRHAQDRVRPWVGIVRRGAISDIGEAASGDEAGWDEARALDADAAAVVSFLG